MFHFRVEDQALTVMIPSRADLQFLCLKSRYHGVSPVSEPSVIHTTPHPNCKGHEVRRPRPFCASGARRCMPEAKFANCPSDKKSRTGHFESVGVQIRFLVIPRGCRRAYRTSRVCRCPDRFPRGFRRPHRTSRCGFRSPDRTPRG